MCIDTLLSAAGASPGYHRRRGTVVCGGLWYHYMDRYRYAYSYRLICIWAVRQIDMYMGGPSTGPALLFIVLVSLCRCEPLRAGCCGGEGVVGVS